MMMSDWKRAIILKVESMGGQTHGSNLTHHVADFDARFRQLPQRVRQEGFVGDREECLDGVEGVHALAIAPCEDDGFRDAHLDRKYPKRWYSSSHKFGALVPPP